MENGQNNDNFNMTEQEMQGLKAIKDMNQEFLRNGEGSKFVREYLAKVRDDDVLLLRYLRGRKNRPKHAWETLKYYAEVRFDKYPEVFPPNFPENSRALFDNHVAGVLRNRDSKGRIILYFNGSEWNTEDYTIGQLLIVAVFVVETLLQHEECVNNGLVFVQQCSGMGMKHVRQYTLNEMLKFLHIFWYAFPLKVKGAYYVNAPYMSGFVYGILKPFLPKKLKERFVIFNEKQFENFHEHLSPDILPKCLGGKLENHEAVDPTLIPNQLKY